MSTSPERRHARVRDDDCLVSLDFQEFDTSMSWSRTKTGTKEARFLVHKEAGWISLTVSETPMSGSKRTTRASASLDPVEACLLWRKLHAIFGPGGTFDGDATSLERKP